MFARFFAKVRAWLILTRGSNLPTVWSNLFAGWLLGYVYADRFPWGPFLLTSLLGLLIGVSLIYVGGMILNDAFDARWDAERRSTRPIPAGLIAVGEALRAGWGALALGFPAIVRSQSDKVKIGHLTPLTGFLGALAAVFFTGLAEGVHELFGYSGEGVGVVESMRKLPWWGCLLVPALGGMCAGIVLLLGKHIAPGQSSTDYMEAIAIGNGHVPIRASLVKSAAALFSIGT